MKEKARRLSAPVCNASILLYIVWLLLPAVQTTGRAMTGAGCVALFALGVVLDTQYFQKNVTGSIYAWFSYLLVVERAA